MTSYIQEPVKVLVCTSLGLLARLLVTSNFKDTLRQRVEVATPTSDWMRVSEAIYLWGSGLDPYAGNVFHEYPINLQIYKLLSSYTNVDLAFALTDVATAYLLHRSTFKQLIITEHSEQVARYRSWIVFLIYLFSPLTLIACGGQTTAIFTNFLVALVCFTLHIEQFRALTCVLCALLACNNIHYATITLPIFLGMEYCSAATKQSKQVYYKDMNISRSLTNSFGIFALSVTTLLIASYMLMQNSCSFLQATYLFVLKVHDLTPNIGLTWYFLTEMFEHFLDFFTWIIQINAFILAIPVAIRLRDKPFFALLITILLATIFQPYPNLAHVSILTSLVPQFTDLIPYTKHGLKISCASIASLSLMPVFWHLWIVMGTANANFYFGATLAFSASLILFMIDLLNANGFAYAEMKFNQLSREKKRVE